MVAKDKAEAKRLAAEDVIERGLTHAQAAAARGIGVNTVTVAVGHELARILGKGLKRMTRKDIRKSDLRRLHESGVSPRTVYSYGCRCDVCLDARGVAHDDVRRRKGRSAGRRLDARMERLMEVAREPIRDYPIYGVGAVTVDPPSCRRSGKGGVDVGEGDLKPCRLCGAVPSHFYGAVARAGDDGRQGVVVCGCGAEVRVKADRLRLGEEGADATACLKRLAVRAWNASMSSDDEGEGDGR